MIALNADTIEMAAGLMVATDKLKINGSDAGIDNYYAMQLEFATSLPLGPYRDRLFIGADIHLPKDHLYSLYTSGMRDPVVLGFGPDARRFSIDVAAAVRIWEHIGIGFGVYVLPDVGSSVELSFGSEYENSHADIQVGYRLAPTVGVYAEVIPGLHLGFAYRAAQTLSLDVPANLYINEAIGTIHTRVDGNAYAEPHVIAFGVSYDFGQIRDDLLHFAVNLDAEYHHYPDPIRMAARVWLYDDSGEVLEGPASSGADYRDAYVIRTALDWMPLDDLRVSVGYGFYKSPVPAQRYIFNVLDADRSQLAFGASGYLPSKWLGGFSPGLAIGAKLDFYTKRDMEKYEFMLNNPGFPSISFEGYTFAFHADLMFRFQ